LKLRFNTSISLKLKIILSLNFGYVLRIRFITTIYIYVLRLCFIATYYCYNITVMIKATI